MLLLPSSFQMLSTIKSTYFLSSFLERPLCCLAFITLIHCSVFKVQSPAFTKTRNKYSILFEYLFPSLLRLVGPSGLEPPTLRLSVVRSSQLSYGPVVDTCSISLAALYTIRLVHFAASPLPRRPASLGSARISDDWLLFKWWR